MGFLACTFNHFGMNIGEIGVCYWDLGDQSVNNKILSIASFILNVL